MGLKRKLLVVDDDWDILRLVAFAMSRDDEWDVVEASSADEALACAKRERPDLVLLDWMMPRVGGQTALEMLRAEPAMAHTPVVVMTALGADERRMTAMIGLVEVIAKPFDPLTLSERMRRALERSQIESYGYGEHSQVARRDAEGRS